MDDKFRSRKWFISLLVFVVATALLVGGYLSEVIWRDTIIVVGGAYFTANVFDKKVQNGQE